MNLQNNKQTSSGENEIQRKPKTSWGWLIFIVLFATVIFWSISAIIV